MPGDPRQGFNFPTAPEQEPQEESPLAFPSRPAQSQQGPGTFNFPTHGNPGYGPRLELDPSGQGGLFKFTDATGQTIDQRAPDGVLGHAIDILSRGQFASTAFVDTLLSGDGGPAAIGRAFAVAGSEAINPSQRLSYSDLIKTHSPGWAAAHPVATTVLGFAGDVALDPTTYLTFGSGASTKFVTTGGKLVKIGNRAAKVGGKTVALSKAGGKVFKQVVERKAAQGLAGEALRESSNKMFSRMVTNPRWSDVLQDAGGVKLFGRNVIGQKAQAAVNNIVRDHIGLTRISAALDNIPGVKTLKEVLKPNVDVVRRTFNRNADLSHEYVETRRLLEAEVIAIDQEVREESIKLFGKLSAPQRERVGLVSAKIDEATRAAEEQAKRSLNPDEARALRDRIVLDEGLSGEELGVFARMHQKYQQVGELEQRAGLLEKLLSNYTPKRYSAIRDAKGFTGVRRKWFRRLANTFTPEEHRKFKTMAEATDAGYDPVLDASVLYTQRIIESRQGIARAQFNDAVESLFGKDVPQAVKQDVTFMGEGIYSRGSSPEVNHYLKLYDGMMGLFRRSATVVRPAFGARQLVSNAMQSFAVLGAKAFGAFDPRVIHDSMLLMNGKPGKFTLKSTFGHTYSGDEVMKLAADHGIVRGISLEGVGAGTTTERMARGVARDIDRIRLARQITGNDKAAEGLAKFMTGITRYTNWPSKIEDFARLSTFMNGLRMGHSPAAAAGVVNEALFDYLHGLSEIESRIIRRVVPFYSFQRFATPMILRAAARAPGRIINPVKAANAFFEGWNQIASGDTMNESTRAAIPGWLLEQPQTFERLDENMKHVFRTFNNFSPLDTFGFVESDENGELDVEQTLRKGFLAQITPFIKVPLEFAVRENFFTGRALPEEIRGARQRAGDLDPDRLLTHLSGIVGSEISGGNLAGVAAGRAVGSLVGSIPGGSEAVLKRAFGWEEGIDPRTGKRQVYINPFLVQSFTAVNPAMADAFKVAREDNTPLERTMQLLFGVGTVKLDLKQQREFKLKRLQSERANMIRDIRRAQREGRDSSLDKRIEEMNEFMEQMKLEALMLTRQDVPGAEAPQ